MGTMQPSETIRYHGLDVLRASAMLLGLVFHAPILYYIPEIADGFKDLGISKDTMPEMELWVSVIAQWIHSWRMPVFFLISGFFSALVLHRNGLVYFLKDRFVRIGLTLIIFASLMDILDGNPTGKLNHFWFLYYLLIITTLFVLTVSFGRNSAAYHLAQGLLASMQRRSGLIPFAAVMILARIICDFIDGGTVKIPTTYFDIKLGGLMYYTVWFFAGAGLFARVAILEILCQPRTLIMLGIAAMFVFPFHHAYADGFFGHLRDPDIGFGDTLMGSFFAAATTFLWSLFALGITHKFVTRGHAIITWLVELSYPVYLFHLPPVIILSALLIGSGLGQATVFFATIVLAFCVSIGVYYVFVKFTPLDWIINGHRKSWLKVPFSARRS